MSGSRGPRQSVLRLQLGQGMAKMRHDVDPENQKTRIRTDREAHSTSLASTFEENSPCRARCLLCRRLRSFNGRKVCFKSRHPHAHVVRPVRAHTDTLTRSTYHTNTTHALPTRPTH